MATLPGLGSREPNVAVCELGGLLIGWYTSPMSNPISDSEMAHLQTLARLELRPKEARTLKQDLNRLLDYFEQIRGLDTEGVEPLARPIATENVFREDTPAPTLPTERIQALATESEEGFFKVPRTVDVGE